jgi:hypothetical protein
VDHPNWGAAWRQRDFDFFTSDAFRKLLQENQIKLITWRDIGKAHKQIVKARCPLSVFSRVKSMSASMKCWPILFGRVVLEGEHHEKNIHRAMALASLVLLFGSLVCCRTI